MARSSLALDIGQAVHRVEQQPAGGAVQRERDGVAGEIAAAQIVLNGGRRIPAAWRPVRAYFSCRDMAIWAVTPLGKTSSTLFRCSSVETVLAPVRSADRLWRS